MKKNYPIFFGIVSVAIIFVILSQVGFLYSISPPQNLIDVEITLERTICYGACPVYSLTLYGNGTVVYEGKRYVKTEGIHSYTIQKEKVADLVRLFYEINYFALDNSYSSQITDQPTTITSLKIENKTKMVSNYGNSGPPKLHELELKIDEYTESESLWRD